MRRPPPPPRPKQTPAEPVQRPSTSLPTGQGLPEARVSGDARGEGRGRGSDVAAAEDTRPLEPTPNLVDNAGVMSPSTSTDAPGVADAQEGPGEEPVGLRDVWRAARARKKVLRAEARRFTVTTRRRRRIWLISVGSVLVLALGSVALAYSPLFAVEKVTVTGTASLDPGSVKGALKDQIGVPLAAVNHDAVKKTLSDFPFIETFNVEARPPHELVVNIRERTPIGVVKRGAEFVLVDGAGVALQTFAERPEGQPALDIGPEGSSSFRAAGDTVRALPAGIRPTVTAVNATTANDVTLTLASGTQVVWGGSSKSGVKAIALARAMAVHGTGASVVYDVSSPDAVVVR